MRNGIAIFTLIAVGLAGVTACEKDEPAGEEAAATGPTETGVTSGASVTGAAVPATLATLPVTAGSELTAPVDLEEFSEIYARVFVIQQKAARLLRSAMQKQDRALFERIQQDTKSSIENAVTSAGMPLDRYKRIVAELNQDPPRSKAVAGMVQERVAEIAEEQQVASGEATGKTERQGSPTGGEFGR